MPRFGRFGAPGPGRFVAGAAGAPIVGVAVSLAWVGIPGMVSNPKLGISAGAGVVAGTVLGGKASDAELDGAEVGAVPLMPVFPFDGNPVD